MGSNLVLFRLFEIFEGVFAFYTRILSSAHPLLAQRNKYTEVIVKDDTVLSLVTVLFF